MPISKIKIAKELQEQINYYKDTGLISIQLPESLTGFRMVSGKFNVNKLTKSFETDTIDEYFQGAWQKARELLISENEEITNSITITTDNGTIQAVEVILTESKIIQTYIFYFENNTTYNESMFNLSVSGMINSQTKKVINTRKIIDILETPNWESLCHSKEIVECLKDKYQWHRLDEGWGLNHTWEEVCKSSEIKEK